MTNLLKSANGFTFVKVAVIIMTVGVLVGVIMIMIALSEQSFMRNIISEHNRYQSFVMTFKQKYDQLPGDTTKALAFMGTEAIRNGNGNRKIEYSLGENALAWKHLFVAKIMNSPELSGEEGFMAVLGENIPASLVSDGGWHFDYAKDSGGNHLGFGAEKENDINMSPIMTPMQAYEIDKRLDDGQRTSGRVHGFSISGQSCGEDSYAIEIKTIECMLTFNLEAQ